MVRPNQLDLSYLVESKMNSKCDYLDAFQKLYFLCEDNYSYDIDGDFDEMLIDSNIKYVSRKEIIKVERDIDANITNAEEGEVIGYDIWIQDEKFFLVPVVCMNNGCVLTDGYDLLNISYKEEENIKSISELTSSELFVEMSDSQKDDIYRMVWSDHVYEDCKDVLKNKEISLVGDDVDDLCNYVSNIYVYEGKYDCELSYWENINNLIDEYLF